MKDRIKLLMESQHMPQNQFANFIGLSPATLSSIFNGRTNPSLQTVEAIRQRLPQLSTDWLIFGTGPMYRNSPTRDDDQKKSDVSPSDEQALAFDNPTAENHEVVDDSSARQVTQFRPKISAVSDTKNFDKTNKHITEIRVFYSDQTYESFVPKK